VHKIFYTESECPKEASRCGDFGDFKCKCNCGRDCSKFGWCGKGGLYSSTKQVEYSNWCVNRPETVHKAKLDNKQVYETKKCPAGKARCGNFGDYSCKCGCEQQCSRWGWCGQGGL